MLRARVVTALFLLAGFLAMLFLLPFIGWIILVSVIAGISAWEWGGLVRMPPLGRGCYALVLMVCCGLAGLFVFDSEVGVIRQGAFLLAIYILAGSFWLVAVPFWLKEKWPTSARIPGLLAGGVVLIPACLALMQLRAFAPLFLLAAMAAVWVADIAAYASGRAFGRHKLAQNISPGKTWEGAAGAAGGVLIYGVVVAWLTSRVPGTSGGWLLLLSALALLTIVSILGDLFESLIKRQAGVKDSGRILPGHGGVLDRIDSLTSTLPLVGMAVLIWEGQMP